MTKLPPIEAGIDSLVSHYVLDDGKLVVAHAGMKQEMQGRGSGNVREFALLVKTRQSRTAGQLLVVIGGTIEQSLKKGIGPQALGIIAIGIACCCRNVAAECSKR